MNIIETETETETTSPLNAKMHRHWTVKMRMLSSIHEEIASTINAKREATEYLLTGGNDKFLAFQPVDLVALDMAINR